MSELGFEGFDHSNDYHMSESEVKKENWDQAKIWVVLGLFMAICLGMTIFLHSKELVLRFGGHSIVAEYKNNPNTISLKDDKGETFYVDIKDTIISPKNGTLTLYYANDMHQAKALTAIWFWLLMYVIWLPLLIICIRCTYKNLKPRHKIS